MAKITHRYFWPKMQQQVINYVRSCPDCQMRRKKILEKPVGLLTPPCSKLPFERLGIDLIGPFPKSALGNKYVIVAVDYFTKWVIVKAVPKATIDFVQEVRHRCALPKKLFIFVNLYHFELAKVFILFLLCNKV